ncbi:sigma-70 family RNA polymerase sigma factor [Methylobacillus glycogenes]|uniref:sigma-70 family RNA polymerase sigma factor n=1 Tax=Methylobacillus glycogenes TaxID=406 RepID=UPI0004711E61|nr:sigma-70 family RNA polymerase sigma factor [Methylobacillus glycogenes]MBL8505726.1 sigma-70 family RNA polymerase sigma factor [Methylobacillus glycogenes]
MSHYNRFELFYSSHQSWLYAYLIRKLRCQHQAADITQDTFVKLIDHQHLDELTQPRAFLTTTAKRILIDLIRRRHLEQTYLQFLQLSQSEQFVDSPEQLAMAVESLLHIANVLDGVTPKAREIFLMNRLDGLKHAEIAAHFGISVARVRQYLAQVIAACCVART